MKKVHYSIVINAPREKVWDTMLNLDTYQQWTKFFNPSSTYEGDWTQGSTIRFVGTDKDGNTGGMISRINENRPHEFISIEHLGMVENGVEDTDSERVQAWKGALENYTFTDVDGGTELSVDQDLDEQEVETMGAMWPKALEALKQLVEK